MNKICFPILALFLFVALGQSASAQDTKKTNFFTSPAISSTTSQPVEPKKTIVSPRIDAKGSFFHPGTKVTTEGMKNSGKTVPERITSTPEKPVKNFFSPSK